MTQTLGGWQMKRPDRAIKWLSNFTKKHKGSGYGIWGLQAVLNYVEYLESQLENYSEKGEEEITK